MWGIEHREGTPNLSKDTGFPTVVAVVHMGFATPWNGGKRVFQPFNEGFRQRLEF